MNFNLPFYGQKGTIKKIVESKKVYTVYYYGLNEQEETIVQVPKNAKNYKLLVENYYKDLNGYLERYRSKYENYKLSKLKKTINPNIINILTLSSVVLIGTSIPLLLTYESLGFLGVVLDALAIPTLITSINLSIKEKTEQKKNKFIDEYQKLEHRLRLYKEEQTSEKQETKYLGLKKTKKEPTRNLKLKKERKKVA